MAEWLGDPIDTHEGSPLDSSWRLNWSRGPRMAARLQADAP
jgi:hypothetical protein